LPLKLKSVLLFEIRRRALNPILRFVSNWQIAREGL